MYKIINRRKLIAVAFIDLVGKLLFGIIGKFRPNQAGMEQFSSPKKILVVRFAYIGDLILTLPILPNLRKLYPDAHITMLTSKKTSVLCQNNPYIDELIVYDAPWFYGGFSLGRIVEYFTFISELRRKHFDMAIDVRADIRNIFFVLFTGSIPRRISYGYGGGAYLLTDCIPYTRLKHKIDLHLDIVRYLGIENGQVLLDVYLEDDEKKRAQSLLKPEIDSDRPYLIAIHPGARVGLKMWDIEKYASLTKNLVTSYPCRIVLLGEEGDQEALAPIEKAFGDKGISLVGKLTLRDLIAVIDACSLLVCNDSAPMHMGVAVNTPTITIFGPSKSMETGPYLFGHKVIEKNFSCRYTCDETNCSYPEFKACLNAISVIEVFTAVKDHICTNRILKEVC